ncbi:MAG TPA: hypothetical protein VM324_11345 [Egibacteraceae bacterium]|nr:hypothetical protein [Egibacteraceae bacterium]
MAHPKLTRRGDPRTLLAAGTAAALLTGPAALAPAAAAVPADEADEVTSAVDCCVEAALPAAAPAPAPPAAPAAEPVATTVVPDPIVQAVVGPIEKVVDDVLQRTPVGGDIAEQAPAVVDTVTEALPAAPLPTDPRGLPATPLTPRAAPESVGTANAPAPPVPTSGASQGTSTFTVPFRARGVATDTTATRRVQPFAAPVMSGPIFADLPRVAEEFLASNAPSSFSSDTFNALRGGQTGTVPGPDAASWLLATAGGMLLLLGAGHLLHARQRYVASVAR